MINFWCYIHRNDKRVRTDLLYHMLWKYQETHVWARLIIMMTSHELKVSQITRLFVQQLVQVNNNKTLKPHIAGFVFVMGTMIWWIHRLVHYVWCTYSALHDHGKRGYDAYILTPQYCYKSAYYFKLNPVRNTNMYLDITTVQHKLKPCGFDRHAVQAVRSFYEIFTC